VSSRATSPSQTYPPRLLRYVVTVISVTVPVAVGAILRIASAPPPPDVMVGVVAFAAAALAAEAKPVPLDEQGHRLTTTQLADRLRFWRADGRDVALLIGGPDGLAPSLKASADETLRLSELTLPHAFVRVLLAEALYRAWSLSAGHPYHRA